jgi:hypothetical protein
MASVALFTRTEPSVGAREFVGPKGEDSPPRCGLPVCNPARNLLTVIVRLPPVCKSKPLNS